MNEERIFGGLWGAVVGDALGVPVEFRSREECRADPVRGVRGYGTHNQPEGAWSDDSSLILCTTESLLNGFDAHRMGELFVRWLYEAHWTPWGQVFGAGETTRKAITKIRNGFDPEQAGGASDGDNGNGSLMRILPVGLWSSYSSFEEIMECANRASSLTHRHPISRMACGIYCFMVSALFRGLEPGQAYREATKEFLRYYKAEPYLEQLPHFARFLSGRIGFLPEEDIRSDGYVVHTLEAAVWCFLTTSTFEEAVLRAVNLGEDADTTATVAGGLAGAYYGLDAIPAEWIQVIARRKDIAMLFRMFFEVLDRE